MADDNYENENNDNNNAGGGDYDDGSTNDDTWALFSQKDDRSCKVYDNDDFFTIFVQLLLAAFALGSLYLKRMREVPRRTFSTWALDVSKQGVGACYAHVCNMAIAAILSQQLDGETKLDDQCAWYGLSYLIDTTLGLVLAIWCLRLQDWLAEKYNLTTILHTGVYNGRDACKHWTHQTIAWLIILTVVKILIYYFMVIFSDMLAFFGSILFAPLQINIRFELLFVMIFFPGFLNVIYFWIADSYLKAKDDSSHAFEDTHKPEKGVALISEEDKKAQAQADADMDAAAQQHHQKTLLERTDWGRHTEFIATYLPSWSVFGAPADPEAEGEIEATTIPTSKGKAATATGSSMA